MRAQDASVCSGFSATRRSSPGSEKRFATGFRAHAVEVGNAAVGVGGEYPTTYAALDAQLTGYPQKSEKDGLGRHKAVIGKVVGFQLRLTLIPVPFRYTLPP
jgi:hypothetical protein